MNTSSPRWRRRWADVRAWPVWDLRPWLLAFVIAVIATAAAAITVAFTLVTWRAADIRLFGLLLACDVATVELTRRKGEPAGHIQEVHAVWELPIAVLLPPFYALLAPAVRIALTQWRVRQTLAYRRMFTAAVLGLSHAAASLLFHSFAPADPQAHATAWALAVLGCGVLRALLNKALVMVAVKGSDPTAHIRTTMLTRQRLVADLAELGTGVCVAYAGASSPLLILCALPVVALWQWYQRHFEFMSAARWDRTTDLPNKDTWTREAGVRVTRATRSREGAPVALLLADLDGFKGVQDRCGGHLAGDVILAQVARTIKGHLRPGDLIGRWGGDEFVALLVDTDAAAARDIAERLCRAVAGIVFQPDPVFAVGVVPQVTISVGLAALGGSHRNVDDLFLAADRAMYQAKVLGGHRVHTVSS